MKILLKDPSKVDAVIENIDSLYPIKGRDSFDEYCVPNIKALIADGQSVILKAEFSFDGARVVSDLGYFTMNDILTDEEYLNSNCDEE